MGSIVSFQVRFLVSWTFPILLHILSLDLGLVEGLCFVLALGLGVEHRGVDLSLHLGFRLYVELLSFVLLSIFLCPFEEAGIFYSLCSHVFLQGVVYLLSRVSFLTLHS